MVTPTSAQTNQHSPQLKATPPPHLLTILSSSKCGLEMSNRQRASSTSPSFPITRCIMVQVALLKRTVQIGNTQQPVCRRTTGLPPGEEEEVAEGHHTRHTVGLEQVCPPTFCHIRATTGPSTG